MRRRQFVLFAALWMLTNVVSAATLRFDQEQYATVVGGEVLVEVRAVSLNYRDLLMATGRYNGKVCIGVRG